MRKWMIWVSAALVTCFVGSAFAPYGEHGRRDEGTRKKEVKRDRKKGKRARGPRSFGTIKSIDVEGKKIVVTTRRRRGGAQEKTFLITDETKIRFGAEEKTIADLADGKNVVVNYKAGEDGGDAIATLIMIRLPSAFGTIKSIDADAKKIVVTVRRRGEREGVEQTFLIDEKTKVSIGREEKTLADLAEGNRVIVEYNEPEKKDDDATAVSVRVFQRRRRRDRKKDA